MPNDFNLRDYLDVLIRRWQIIVAMPILAVLAAAMATMAIPPTYEATATLALAPSTVSISLASQLPPYYLMVDSPRHLPVAFTPTFYIALIKGADVVTAAQPRAAISLAADSNDRSLIAITARGDSPQVVADSANQYAQASAQRIQQALAPSGAESAAAKKILDAAQTALDQFLRDHHLTDYDLTASAGLSPDQRKQYSDLARARDLAESVYLDLARDDAKSAILADTTLRPTIIPAPVPTGSIAPKMSQNLLLGAAFGLLIGILGVFTLEFMRRR